MSRASSLILLGILVALSPFIGLPLSVLAWILPILGIMIVLTGISFRVRRPREEASPAPVAAPSFDTHESQGTSVQ